MSHDLQTFFDLHKVFGEIDKNDFRVQELIHHELINRNQFKRERNHKQLLKDVFLLRHLPTIKMPKRLAMKCVS